MIEDGFNLDVKVAQGMENMLGIVSVLMNSKRHVEKSVGKNADTESSHPRFCSLLRPPI